MHKDLQWNLAGAEPYKNMSLPQLKQVYQRVSVLHETMPSILRSGKAKRRERDEGQSAELLTGEPWRMIAHLFDNLKIALNH